MAALALADGDAVLVVVAIMAAAAVTRGEADITARVTRPTKMVKRGGGRRRFMGSWSAPVPTARQTGNGISPDKEEEVLRAPSWPTANSTRFARLESNSARWLQLQLQSTQFSPCRYDVDARE
jgi:hypothetical protein